MSRTATKAVKIRTILGLQCVRSMCSQAELDAMEAGVAAMEEKRKKRNAGEPANAEEQAEEEVT